MKRSTVATDRIACAIAGGALIALGGFAAAWQYGELPVPPRGAVRLPWLPNVTNAAWWPFALGVAAIVAVLVGSRWLLIHRPGQRLSNAALPGSGVKGHLGVDVSTAAAAAAADLEDHPRIVAARGTTFLDRGQQLIELDVTIDTAAGSLRAAARAVDVVHRDLAEALDGMPHVNRVLLRTARAHRGASRVR